MIYFRYDTTDDFTVVLQPFTKLFNAPNANPRSAPPIDATLVTHDCFHFSQKGHALGKNNDISLLFEKQHLLKKPYVTIKQIFFDTW